MDGGQGDYVVEVHDPSFAAPWKWRRAGFLVPFTTACVWFVMLIVLGIIWLAVGSPDYGNNSDIAFISEIGGAYLGIFIPFCSITAGGLSMTRACMTRLSRACN
jgi:hypothetical protein